jgi:hypothetical protein
MVMRNPWWESDPHQRYWLEITSRGDLGKDLKNPKTAMNGKPTPGYESILHVKPGDVIFHYWQQPSQEPAIVSWSLATGEARTSSIDWVPHGKNNYKQKPTTRPAWKVSLGGMTDLTEPVTLSEIRSKEDGVRAIRNALESSQERPIYFPFIFYSTGPIRAVQSYLVKFPKELIKLFPILNEPITNESIRTPPKKTNPATKQKTAGYISDPKLRRAIELQAMKQAEQYLAENKYEVTDVSAKESYDLHGKSDEEVLRVEVKGSSGTATTVELTIGEVKKARESDAEAVLIVVDQIPWKTTAKGIVTSEGRFRVWRQWELDRSRLQAIRFRYLLPPN